MLLQRHRSNIAMDFLSIKNYLIENLTESVRFAANILST